MSTEAHLAIPETSDMVLEDALHRLDEQLLGAGLDQDAEARVWGERPGRPA
ncbi:MAG: hypothetical protein IPP07_15040 [Holophagales bacterium]|nr:hypothetical protein [Holophagales bacterium]